MYCQGPLRVHHLVTGLWRLQTVDYSENERLLPLNSSFFELTYEDTGSA